MFFPVISFLDADKKPISTSGTWTQSRGGFFTDELAEAVFLEEVEWIQPDTPYRYIVIHTTRERIARGGMAALATPVQVAAASYHMVPIFIPSGPTGPIHLEGSPVGYLRIKPEPPKP